MLNSSIVVVLLCCSILSRVFEARHGATFIISLFAVVDSVLSRVHTIEVAFHAILSW